MLDFLRKKEEQVETQIPSSDVTDVTDVANVSRETDEVSPNEEATDVQETDADVQEQQAQDEEQDEAQESDSAAEDVDAEEDTDPLVKLQEELDDAEKRAETYAKRLHEALVRLDGRLADPKDLDFSLDHLDNPDALDEAIGDLIKRKPGLRARQLSGDVGAGARGNEKQAKPDLMQLMKAL